MIDDELEGTENEVLPPIDSEGTDLPAEEVLVLDNSDPMSSDPEELEEYEYEILSDDAGDHLFYSTDFSDYTVSEGLLLLIFVILVVDFFMNLVRRWF